LELLNISRQKSIGTSGKYSGMKKSSLTKEKYPADLMQDIRKIRSILLRYGASKIILYGSFARGDYRANSDIDICVAGLSNKNYFRAIAECLMKAKRHVSVLDLQTVHGYLRDRILQEGRIIYESK
jgi:predicted nucleotidyltransferase